MRWRLFFCPSCLQDLQRGLFRLCSGDRREYLVYESETKVTSYFPLLLLLTVLCVFSALLCPKQNELPQHRVVIASLSCQAHVLWVAQHPAHTVVANNAAPHWLSANLPLWEVIGQAICSIGGIKSEIRPPCKMCGGSYFVLPKANWSIASAALISNGSYSR